MKIRILSLLFCIVVFPALAQSQSQTCTPAQAESPFSCSITFSPGTTGISTGVFDFSSVGDGIIKFQFDTVLTTFTLTVSANETAPDGITNIDQNELPNASCITISVLNCAYGSAIDVCSKEGVSRTRMTRTSAPPFASFASLRLSENCRLTEEASLSQRRKGAKAPDLSGGVTAAG